MEVARRFLESKYGKCNIEFSQVYEYHEYVEVSGTIRLEGDRNLRRFTLKIETDSLLVKGYGMR
ncbi:MAG: hypothetical protein QW756_04655 [Nitrososphaerota archaeon]